MSASTTSSVAPTLRRALGRWDLTAIGVNQVIGGAIFLMPSQLAAQIGPWGPIGMVLMGLASLSVALCFAEVGSRFEGTGGPYLYTRAAFGRFVGFEVGWMQWFTRAASQASVMAGIAVALGYYWPVMTTGWPRHLVLTAVTAALAWINVRGIRQSAWVVNALTIGKLLPLALFIIVGVAYVDPARLTTLPPISSEMMFSRSAMGWSRPIASRSRTTSCCTRRLRAVRASARRSASISVIDWKGTPEGTCSSGSPRDRHSFRSASGISSVTSPTP